MSVTINAYKYYNPVYRLESYTGVLTENIIPIRYDYDGYINCFPSAIIPVHDISVMLADPQSTYSPTDLANKIIANGVMNEISGETDKHSGSKIVLVNEDYVVHYVYYTHRLTSPVRYYADSLFLVFTTSGTYVTQVQGGNTIRKNTLLSDYNALPEYVRFSNYRTNIYVVAWDTLNSRFSLPGSFSTTVAWAASIFTAVTTVPDPHPDPIQSTDPYYDVDGEDEISGGGVDAVPIPGFPPANATATGIIGLFAPSASEMQQLADFMWTDFGGTATDILDALKEIVQAFKRSISNPLDYIVGLNIIPSRGLSVGSSSIIKFGFVSSGVSMPRLTSQYFEVDCGTLQFDTLCGDTFLDYAPYSKFSIYLPYIGFKEVDANDFVGHTIGVVYHGDVVTGGVTAYITKDGSVMYQYSGSCALNVPLSSDNWGSTISAAVNIATAAISGFGAGGIAGASNAAYVGASQVASNISLLSPQVQHSGAVSGSAGCMAVQYPFVIREAVRFHSTLDFNRVTGYPSYYYRQLSAVSGYTTVVNVHLENVPATEVEISEIEKMLKEGVIL